MSIENRINKLEKQTDPIGEKTWLVVVYDDTGKPSEAELEKAKAKYRKEHPDWQERGVTVIWVIDEETREGVQRVMDGERTE